ncbi:MAG TPA: Crp/Fnr family transcriptional regulator [Tissierellia bacterium]|nr:Crp/Fnr family transcriptional regulator [Tissierellia bacterium]
MAVKTCIELVPIFSTLTFDEMMEVASITTSRTYKKGEMVYFQGDREKKLYVIHKGRVKISRISSSGKEQVIRILGPGEFMGELSLFNDEPNANNAEVIEDATVCIIDGDKLKSLMAKYPSIAFKVLEELSLRLKRAENLIENLGIRDVESRIAEKLLELADDEGNIILTMKKGDLASHLGMSQETLSRKLSYFQDEGWIELKGHKKIKILDRENLESLL